MIVLDLTDVIFVNGNSWVLEVLNPTITLPDERES